LGALASELYRAGGSGAGEKVVLGDVLDETVRIIRNLRTREGWKPLADAAVSKRADWRFRFYLVRGPSGIADPGVSDALLKVMGTHDARRDRRALNNDDPRVLAAAFEAAGQRGVKEALPYLHLAVQSASLPWETRLNAVDAIKTLADATSVDSLIEALGSIKDSETRLKASVIEALQRITGVRLELADPKDWKAASESRQEGAPNPSNAGRRVETHATTFFGLTTRSTRMIFVLDKSGSMAEPASERETPPPPPDPKPAKPEEKIGIEGSGSGSSLAPKDPKVKNPDPLDPTRDLNSAEQQALAQARAIHDRWTASKKPATRIELLKKEFIRTLYHLGHRIWFTTIWYDTNVQVWSNELVPATWVNKLAAMIHTDRIAPDGMTNLGDAPIENALRIVSTGGA
jgi:hypothetical protein